MTMRKPDHELYDRLLTAMEQHSSVSKNVLARVLVRVMISAPREVSRAEIARGEMLAKRSTINQSAVSKAVQCLLDAGLVTQYGDRSGQSGQSGRPVLPLTLGSSEWALMGIKVIHREDRPVRLYGVLTGLRVDKNLNFLAEQSMDLPEDVTFRTVDEHIAKLHDQLLAQAAHAPQLLGVGVEVASHVHDGAVVGATHVGLSADETFDLLTPLQQRLPRVKLQLTTKEEDEKEPTEKTYDVQVPVVIDNDVNVLAVRETYRPRADRHAAVVGVFNDGVGASLIIDGHVYRGGGGMAAEPGHQTVTALPTPPADVAQSSDRPGFAEPCHCGRIGHVDCYATPARLSAQLGTTLAEAGQQPSHDEKGQLTAAGWVFRAGGEALGQGVAGIVNVVNPSRVLLMLPGALARPGSPVVTGSGHADGRAQSGSAAAEYLNGVEAALNKYCFSSGASDARGKGQYLTVQILDPDQAEQQGAVCAAVRVLDVFVMHARGRDRCHELAPDGSTPPAE